ncbi:MAG: fibronectin type III domain-containing protein, partial [Chromatiales bacterium]
MKRARLVTLVLATSIASSASALEAPVLESDSEIATAGFFRLQWESADLEGAYELQEASRADFADSRVLYTGPDLATVLSGKPDGDYHYRVRRMHEEGRSAWSAPVQVQVRA